MQLRWFLSLLFCLSTSFGEVEVKQAIGEIIRQDGRIFTGSNSRVEVEFPLATVRIGSNADFRYASDYREMILNRGTVFLSARDDLILYSGLVTMKTSRGDFLVSNVPGFYTKVIALDGKGRVFFAGKQSNLRFGEMVEIPANATKMSGVTVIDLDKLMESSLLLNMGPLRNQWKIDRNASRQDPRPVSLVNTPPMIAASRATATAMGVNRIEAQRALQAQQLANQELLSDRRQQRLAEQAAARQAVQQASQQLDAKRQSEEQAQARARQVELLQRQQAERQRIEQINRGNNAGGGNLGQGNQGQGNPNPPGQGGIPPGQLP